MHTYIEKILFSETWGMSVRRCDGFVESVEVDGGERLG